jgi:hypothetical protein
MSRPKYAPITSSLLVRKGEAKPWIAPRPEFFEFHTDAHSTVEMPAYDSTFDEHPAAQHGLYNGAHRDTHYVKPAEPVWHKPHDPTHDEHTKRCTIRLSPAEYERLGIVAVKKEISRQQVLRQAIEHYLAEARAEYQSACGCLANGGCTKGC